MSESTYPATPTAGARPRSVTISSYLLYAVAAFQAIRSILTLSVLDETQRVLKDIYAGTPAEGAESIAAIGGIGGVVVGLLIAVGLIVLATLNREGRNVSRIVTWVIGGIGLCCDGIGLVGTAGSGMMNTGGNGVPSAAEVQRRFDEALPSWYGPANTVLMVLTPLALLVALILLALPASNEFFRKPQVLGWEPPVPGSFYAGHPQSTPPAGGQQAYPGYPQTSGFPQEPQTNPPGDQSGPPTPPAG